MHSARTILDHVRRSIGVAEFSRLADNELLRLAVVGRDHKSEAAFAILVQRHGPLVYRTCVGMLRHAQDAEDAFQATFLVLARKAKTLRAKPCVGPWLYEVARRIAAHARVAAERRTRHERQVGAPESQVDVRPDHESLEKLHDALGRLPARQRLPIVLCDLEELSYKDAAERLGLSTPTLRNRLARGRQRLRRHLNRQGLDANSASIAYAAIPAAPRILLDTTAVTAAKFTLGTLAGTASVSILTLANQGLQSMQLVKLKTIGLAFLAASVLVASAVGTSGQSKTEASKPNDPSPMPVNANGFELQKLDASDLADFTGVNIYKFRLELRKGRFSVVLREVLDKDAAPRELKRFNFEKLSDEPLTMRVGILGLDQKLTSFLLSNEKLARIRVDCPGCHPSQLSSVVEQPLPDIELTRKSLWVARSDKQVNEMGAQGLQLITVMTSNSKGLFPSNLPRAELVVLPEL